MANEQTSNVFRSFEQFKAELFPCLTENERRRSEKLDYKQIGACMADKAVDALLKKERKSLR